MRSAFEVNNVNNNIKKGQESELEHAQDLPNYWLFHKELAFKGELTEYWSVLHIADHSIFPNQNSPAHKRREVGNYRL